MQISSENLQELDLRHVEDRQIKKELEKLIQDYKPEKTASTVVTMRIILKHEEPVCQPPRRLAFTERQEWYWARTCDKASNSPIPIPLGYRGHYLSSKMFWTLKEAKVYSTLDLRNGFFYVDVDEDCRKYTSFIVPDGQFEFNKVLFGLSTSLGVFQSYVSSMFRDLTRKGIVISYYEQEGLEKLNIIFEVAEKYGLEIKFKKCQFLKKKIEFLGHIVKSGTIKPSPTKTLAV
ncbi:retrovirus-related Pol polyprotein from transposon 412 [Trichonephila clavipes]|nr:retrovirus-related Pol polyprotein from transposon 412 [Trichonephila clavipes]